MKKRVRWRGVAVFFVTACVVACKREAASDGERLAKAIAQPDAYAADVERECNDGVMRSCTSLGIHHAFGTYGRTVDHAKARVLFERSCAGGDAQGCHELGVLYEHGRGVAVDHARARELYESACSGGVANSCHYLGDYASSGKGGAAKDPVLASRWYAKACAAGSKSSCGK